MTRVVRGVGPVSSLVPLVRVDRSQLVKRFDFEVVVWRRDHRHRSVRVTADPVGVEPAEPYP